MEHTVLLKRGLLLEYLTLSWNVIGVVMVILAAIAARSVALAGFGLDSLIEIFASVVVVWQLTGGNLRRERRALRLIGMAFLLLAAYILAQLVVTLLTGTRPTTSLEGNFMPPPTLFCTLQVYALPEVTRVTASSFKVGD